MPITARQQATAPSNLDAFMARVLEHRDEAWKKLHDYVLNETERFDLNGPAGAHLDGTKRDYTWYVREGYLIRSPLRFDGVTIPETERRKYEETWLKDEKARAAGRRGGSVGVNASGVEMRDAGQTEASLQQFVEQRGEPRFISESFFLKFKFEPGNYYLVGRERLDGRDVVRIEYYPTSLFKAEKEKRGADANDGAKAKETAKESAKEREEERRLLRDMNKVSLVTLWIDPVEYQVVRYKFDNVDFGFLPGRWLIRVDSLTATMTMARVLDGVWLPTRMSADAGFTLATGNYTIQYARDLYDYKKAETAAKIREYREPKK